MAYAKKFRPSKGAKQKGGLGQRPPTPAAPIRQHKQLAGSGSRGQ